MSRYAIWDKTSEIYTPVGEVLSAQQWRARYPWANIPGSKMIVGGGLINGSVAMEFNAAVEHYARMGCDFSWCATDADYLTAIEVFEDTPPQPVYTDETRIADALEDLVVLGMPDAT